MTRRISRRTRAISSPDGVPSARAQSSASVIDRSLSRWRSRPSDTSPSRGTGQGRLITPGSRSRAARRPPGAGARLADVPVNADPAEARTAVAAMVAGLARDFHGADVEVTWNPPREPWAWTAQVTLVATAPNT
ncbi:hypothetical protein ACQUSR_34040 [Streptomyces sp. P1-3]|uniref:hypothetical protein n=1 Tax=Streptomyces sp. P1-3 TaxID=3421658 RepID=UPI003D360023